MNPPELVVLCNEAATGRSEDASTVKLRTYGSHRNIRLKLDQIGRQLNRDIPPRLVDLIEIAAMVYIADQIAHRGAHDVELMGAYWRRQLHFEISVRDRAFWASPEARDALVDLLSFLSEDEYEFTFSQFRSPPALDRYLEFGDDGSQPAPQSVILFSGGLDSLGGAVERVVAGGERAILVSHESSPKLRTRLRALRGMIDAAAGNAAPQHVTVTVNKEDMTERDYTQRSRSFLYASLATAVARMAGLNAIRFFENGVVSLNLPLSPQIIGTRATRTTHPKVLASMRRLMSLVTEEPFDVTNDFIWRTKSEVVQAIVAAGHGAMIPLSTSCTHTWEMRTEHPHCGTCSQCIDRRFAILAGGAGDFERADTYRCDLLVGERSAGESRIMLASYVETAQQVGNMDEARFFSRYGEAARALRHVGLDDDEAARRIVDMYRRHSAQVMSVVDQGVARYSNAIRARSLPESCLVRLVHDPRPSSGMPSSVTPPTSSESQYELRRFGEGWDLRFRGNLTRLTHRIGLIYIDQLIRFPHQRFTVAKLFLLARPGAPHVPVAKGEATMDSLELQAIAERLREIASERDEAEQNADHASVDRLDRERDDLVQELRDAGFAGRPKVESQEQKRLRQRVRKAIKDTIQGIRRYDAGAADHFDGATSYGATVIYAPTSLPAWEF